MDHYANFFAFATDCFVDGDPPLIMTAQDKADLVAFLKSAEAAAEFEKQGFHAPRALAAYAAPSASREA